jgi:hypothetical protein
MIEFIFIAVVLTADDRYVPAVFPDEAACREAVEKVRTLTGVTAVSDCVKLRFTRIGGK